MVFLDRFSAFFWSKNTFLVCFCAFLRFCTVFYGFLPRETQKKALILVKKGGNQDLVLVLVNRSLQEGGNQKWGLAPIFRVGGNQKMLLVGCQ